MAKNTEKTTKFTCPHCSKQFTIMLVVSAEHWPVSIAEVRFGTLHQYTEQGQDRIEPAPPLPKGTPEY